MLVTFAAAFTALELLAYTQKSATWDEPIHLTAGYAALAQGDYRMDPSHPPFLRMWSALPLLAADGLRADTGVIDRTPILSWLEGTGAPYDFSRQFLYSRDDADRLLYAARFMVVILGIVGGILVFCWANEWLGFLPAVCALIFYTVEPNLSAHASLVTTDFGLTCFMFGTIYFLWRTSRGATPFNIAALTTFFALAVVTKFSAVLLGLIVLALLALSVAWRSAITAKAAAGIIALLGATAFVAIWAICGFQYAPSESGAWLLRLQDVEPVRQAVPNVAKVVGWIDARHLLPNIFTQGFLFCLATVQEQTTFLAGQYSNDGWWFYFPVAFLIKTPIALLALSIGGVFVYIRRGRKLGSANKAFVVLPIVVYLGFAMTSGFNIGVRHILPIYPFVILIAAAAARELIVAHRPRHRIALAALAGLAIAEFGGVWPHTLTFFNQLVGGPRNGFRYLADSNVDWGQDLKPLGQWMRRNGVDHVNLAYFGQADPAYYHINSTPLPASFDNTPTTKPQLPGYVAIGATVLSGVYLEPEWRLFYKPFHDRPPIADIGNSIRIYWVDQWPTDTHQTGIAPIPSEVDSHRALADALFTQEWYELAAKHYQLHLEYRPKSRPNRGGALTNLAIALVATGKTDEAIEAFRRAATVNPTNGGMQRNLANALADSGEIDEAAVYARRAVVSQPDDPAAFDLLGEVLARQGRLDEATDAFERSLHVDPTYAEARDHLVQIAEMRRSR